MARASFAPIKEAAWFDPLQAQIQGEVIAPDDPEYDVMRRAWNLTVDHRPLLIVVPEAAADIAAAVRFAKIQRLSVAIQATGHSVGRPANKHTLLINTARMTDVSVDAQAQTAWVQAGAQWRAVLERAQEFSLAPLLGSSPEVGAVGYTLGGGMGWLARKYGMSLDSVNWFEVVTPDGQLVRASAVENRDLFWALRGGGGNFGVVTAMEIKLYPVSTIYGGNLIYPATLAGEIMARFREWIKANPDEMTSSVALYNFPPFPQIPELLRGKSLVFVRGAYVGDADEGADRIQPWLEWQTPIANTWREMPFGEVATISNDPVDPAPSFSSGLWLRDLTDEAIATIVRYMFPAQGASPLAFTEMRHAGGAIARVAADANAYSNRDAQLVLQMVGAAPTPEVYARVKDYVEQYRRDLQPALTGKLYPNFNVNETLREHGRDAFSEDNYRRLQALKARYDADSRFDHAFAIEPEA